MGTSLYKLITTCKKCPEDEPQLVQEVEFPLCMPKTHIVKSKTMESKPFAQSTEEPSFRKYITADYKGRLVSDVNEHDSSGTIDEYGVDEYLQRLLAQYRSSRLEELRLKLGKLNVPLDCNDFQGVITRGPVLMADFGIYIGDWSATGKRQGLGLAYLPEGSIYEGQWEINLPSGIGRFIFNSCDHYEGQFELGTISGIGRMDRTDESFYEGEWVNSYQHGKGREEWADGQKYEGLYRQGKKHGLGRFAWDSDSYYEGEFVENRIEGQGICIWSNGRKYTGGWKNNLMDGHGRFATEDGKVYEGEYKEGQKHGYGTYTWSSGKRYEGYWANGQQHGEGIVFEPGNSIGRKGIWERGRRTQ